jgi:dextranase
MFNVLLWLCLFVAGCKKNRPENNPVTYGTSINITTDKAVYQPGDNIVFTIDNALPPTVKLRYRNLDHTQSESILPGTTWQWTAPAADYTGYLVDLYETVGGTEKVYGSIAIDVSSDWTRFPRYGFLSEFGQLGSQDMDKVINNLTRYHINGLQFYDWQDKHHHPLAGTVAAPAAMWKDIARRDTYKSTVQGYIDRAHRAGMNAMFYNLCYGALSDAASDGVKSEWYLYKDAAHTQKDFYDLPNPPFKSAIYFLAPSNIAWQQYLSGKNTDVYQVYNFDGYHIDQVGDRGKVYDYNGSPVELANTFKPFIESMKTAEPSKRLVMNAVNQYGQQGSIAAAPVDFLYSEVWAPNEGYTDLADIIRNNDAYSSNSKKTVLTAYMNYNLASAPGFFNTPAVLLTDAVIFAFGGAHLELGEHMLGKEYFPNNNLAMKEDLKTASIKYYDFLVAYENLLRDGGGFNVPAVTCTNGKMKLNNWPPQNGSVSVVGKEFASRQVLHFINFANAATFDWRDTNGIQTRPNTIDKPAIGLTTGRTVARVWLASPDINSGVATVLPFTQTGSSVSFSLPSLQYWDMVVVEYR